MREINIVRRKYYPQTTIGDLYIDDKWLCYTLEDSVRPSDIKVKHFTAIPVGTYFVTTRYSPSFEREVIQIYNDETQTKVTNDKVEFSWIYIHGGNKHQDTSGCIIVGYENNGNTIYSTAEKDLYDIIIDWLNNGHEVLVTIANSPQSN